MTTSTTDNHVESLNSHLSEKDWNQIEERVDIEVQKVIDLLTNTSRQDTRSDITVLGERLFVSVRGQFPKLFAEQLKQTEEKATSSATSTARGKKGSKAPVVKASDKIRWDNVAKSLVSEAQALLSTLSESVLQTDFGIRHKYFEFRGILLAYIAWFILHSKFAKAYQQEKKSTVYGIIVSMERFIEACKTYEGKSLLNPLISVSVAPTLVTDLEIWLTRLKAKFPCDGQTILKENPLLLLGGPYDKALPENPAKIRKSQQDLVDLLEANCEGVLAFYKAPTGSGKTTLAVAIPSLIKKLAANGRFHTGLPQFLFCCNVPAVRIQVARYCYNAGIPFGMSFWKSSKNKFIVRYQNNTSAETCRVIVACPKGCVDLLDKDPESALNYWLYLDEPTYGADLVKDSDSKDDKQKVSKDEQKRKDDLKAAQKAALNANAELLTKLPRVTVLSSATLPEPKQLPVLLECHNKRYPGIPIVEQVSGEIPIGCEIRTFDDILVVLHKFGDTPKKLRHFIKVLTSNPALMKILSYSTLEKLWRAMTVSGIAGILDVPTHFGKVTNMSAEKVRIACLELLDILGNQAPEIIKSVCSFRSTEEQPSPIDFSRLGTTEAAKFPNATLIVASDPLTYAKSAFQTLLTDLEVSGINPETFKVMTSDFKKKLEEYQKAVSKKGNVKKKSSNTQNDEHLLREEDAKTEIGKPSLKIPECFQVNTASHRAKYQKQNATAPVTVRSVLSIEDFPFEELYSNCEDWIVLLLCLGIGIYAPDQIDNKSFNKLVLELAEKGLLTFIVSDVSLAYGATLRNLCQVIIEPAFALPKSHSLFTLLQVMGRAGRGQASPKSTIYMDPDAISRLVDFATNPESTEGELEARNINEAMTQKLREYSVLEERKQLREQEEMQHRREEEDKLLQKVESAKQNVDKYVAELLIQQDKTVDGWRRGEGEGVTNRNHSPKRSCEEFGEWRRKGPDIQPQKQDKTVDAWRRGETSTTDPPKRSCEEFGEWRRKDPNMQPHTRAIERVNWRN